jgi:hypothetical protein
VFQVVPPDLKKEYSTPTEQQPRGSSQIARYTAFIRTGNRARKIRVGRIS